MWRCGSVAGVRKRQAAATPQTPAQQPLLYDLERLFTDQEPELVCDSIAHLLAWVPGTSKASVDFAIERRVGAVDDLVALRVAWSLPVLTRLIPGLSAHARRLRSGRTGEREHVPEMAAYALAFVAISALTPGRRVVAFRKGSAPDLLFDLTAGAERGVEVAGRSTGGYGALRTARDGSEGKVGKAAQLHALPYVAEAHLSLWCAEPSVGLWERVKP